MEECAKVCLGAFPSFNFAPSMNDSLSILCDSSQGINLPGSNVGDG